MTTPSLCFLAYSSFWLWLFAFFFLCFFLFICFVVFVWRSTLISDPRFFPYHLRLHIHGSTHCQSKHISHLVCTHCCTGLSRFLFIAAFFLSGCPFPADTSPHSTRQLFTSTIRYFVTFLPLSSCLCTPMTSVSQCFLSACSMVSNQIHLTVVPRPKTSYKPHASKFLISTPFFAVTSPITCTSASPAARRLRTVSSTWFLPTTITKPIPLLKVRAISSGSTPPYFITKRQIDGNCHDEASIKQPVPFGSTLGMFSMKPPPVMCDIPLSRPACTAGSTCLMYILVGSRRARPSVTWIFHGQGDEYDKPEIETTLRMREKPLECGPEAERPRRISPGVMLGRGKIRFRSTAPTAKPARS